MGSPRSDAPNHRRWPSLRPKIGPTDPRGPQSVGDRLAVQAQLFARLRELYGARELDLDLASPASVADCFTALVALCPEAESFRERLLVAVNETYSTWEQELSSGDVVAFIPPVSGGCPQDQLVPQPATILVTREPICAADLIVCVRSPAAGALVTFEGRVRDHHQGKAVSHLEYEAYAPMATKILGEIAAAASRRWQLEGVAIRHRTGHLEIGEVSVAIAVSAAHRAEAFAACQYTIDRLKATAPIWKKEFGSDGASWIEGPESIGSGG